MGTFSRWLRQNAEARLMAATQKDLAQRHLGREGTVHRPTSSDAFWNDLFVPIYRKLPWGLRRFVLRRLPGSHHRQWRGGNPL